MFSQTNDRITVTDKLTIHLQKVDDCIFIHSPFIASLKAKAINFYLYSNHIAVHNYVVGMGVTTEGKNSIVEYNKTGNYKFEEDTILCCEGGVFKLTYVYEDKKFLCKEYKCSFSSEHIALY